MRRVLAFYKFVPLNDVQASRDALEARGRALRIRGTILVAEEGVNGTVVGEVASLEQLQAFLSERFGEIPFKWSDVDEANPAFYRFKVKIKPEIVSFGVEGLDLAKRGEAVDASRWNRLLDDANVVVIDTRNQYEVDVGTFPGALSPGTENFRQFPEWADESLDPAETKEVAMFCTGGIRCEKASSYLLNKGFERVYQLDGGILSYLETVDASANRWRGECFVFDQRVSVTSDLEQGQYEQCFACRHPLSQDDLESPRYEPGVQCPYCHAELADSRLQQLRERQKQVILAEARGDQHIGAPQAQHRTERFEEN